MSQYYGSITGNKSEATRQGTKVSGLSTRVGGWETGVRVELCWNADAERDEVFVFRTAGSNGRESDELIARWLDGDETQLFG